MEPIPVGIEGELYLGGAGLARGYLNDASLTAEKFVPGPFGGAGARLYRTGDRARYLADGRIEFLGRIDQQVKIRGYRIEPGEIESVLSQHPAVKNCVVVAHAGTGGKSLVAYTVLARPGESVMEELRTFLKEKLPAFMVPTFFVELNDLPLTPNGKVDRKALPNPDQATDLKQSFVAPRNDIEQRLTAIWMRVLGRNEIGVQDNFFELGGHSLLAVRLMAEIEKEWGQKIPLVSLFQTATIEGLSRILQSNVASISWPTVVEIQAGNSRPPLFGVSTPNVNALGYRSLARYLGPDQPVYGLQAQYPEDLEGEHSRAAVGELATAYLSAMRAVRASGPYQLIGLCRGAHIAYEIARRLEEEGQQVALLGILDTWVLENTYSHYWYVEHYARRLSSFLHMGFRNQLAFIRKKAQDLLRNAREADGQVRPARPSNINPLHETYFPGADFVPPTYRGAIAVFRVRRQPLNRIRDKQLGWGSRTSGAVDIHIVPGKHGNILNEPNVGGLAEELKKWLLKE
jgi:thioesterase domain-containing protein/acyl carrier protein